MEAKLQRKTDQNMQADTPNLTGIPTQMKLDLEQRSGLSFDDVRVHYNSDKPAQFLARAYTFGTQVHIGPGQERYLSHELGHVAQQKWGIVRPTGSMNGIPAAESPGLEEAADRLEALRPGTPAVQEPGGILQRMGAVSLTELLEINGHSVDSLPNPIRKLIQDYENLYDAGARMDFDQQLVVLQTLNVAIQTISEETTRRCMQAIVENEIQIVTKQRAVDWEAKRKELAQAESTQEEINAKIKAMEPKPNEDTAAEKEAMEPRPQRDEFSEINMQRLKMKQKNLQVKIDTLKLFKDTSRQEDPYKFMDEGAEWKRPEYTRFYTAGQKDKVGQLSAANLRSIQEAVVVSGAHTVKVRDIPGYNKLCGRIKTLLTSRTILTHYSNLPDLPVLLSKEYAIASRISLDRDNSDKQMERELKNTGFVFFFLERDNRPPRQTTRFGHFRYVITDPQRVLSRSWAMLADFITAYQNYSPKTIVRANSTEGQGGTDKQMQSNSKSLDTTMTYLPSGITIEFERFQNILKGEHIIEGLAQSAAQQLYALYNVRRDINMTFDQIQTGGDDELLDAVLRMFEVQVMVPKAVVPDRMDRPV